MNQIKLVELASNTVFPAQGGIGYGDQRTNFTANDHCVLTFDEERLGVVVTLKHNGHVRQFMLPWTQVKYVEFVVKVKTKPAETAPTT